MVGDRRFDMECAKKGGIGAIGAGDGYGSREELMNSGCDVYCETVEDIIRHLCPGEEVAVSYTHLDVYKRQGEGSLLDFCDGIGNDDGRQRSAVVEST